MSNSPIAVAPQPKQGPQTLEGRLLARLEKLTHWLEENAPDTQDEQKHLDAGSVEQAYWHYGYAAALRDLLDTLPDGKTLS